MQGGPLSLFRRVVGRGGSRAAEPPGAEASPEELPLEWDRHALRVIVSTGLERKKRTRPRTYEPFTVDWLEAHVAPGDRFYDIGANIGTFSLMAGALLRAGARGEQAGSVFAFEPSYSTYQRLCENVSLNGLDGTIVPVPLLLAASSGLGVLAYRDRSPGASRHRVLEDGQAAFDKAERKGARNLQRLVMLALDDLLAVCRLPPPSLMKIDIDGGELEFLRGAGATLRDPALRSLIIETDPGLAEACQALMTDAGLTLAEQFTTGREREVRYLVMRR